ncbi:MAG: riboflavin kinase [Bacteroidales bacterium]|jgi:riboflavin kinase/FMN adenylyltransferase|nr:riboflavin kinase [Bacteroidales bacterium]
MQAIVVEGRKIGRTLGFPTANLEFENSSQMPPNGVYAVDVIINNQLFKGVLNVGIRPTFGASERVAEVHILDFNQIIYGRTIDITIRKFIRSEQTFDTPDALKQQIQKDKAQASI